MDRSFDRSSDQFIKLINNIFRPVQCSSDLESKKQLYGVLSDYNLTNAFEMGKIFFAVDGGLYNAVHEMFVKDHGLEPLVSICSPHNWGNATKRALDENLVRYLPDGASTIEVIFFQLWIDPRSIFIQICLKIFSGSSNTHKRSQSRIW